MIVLTIAGSDSSAGAGIQADLKTIAANGCYGASVITSITSQNTQGINDIYDVPISVIESQFEAVVSDLDVQFIKIGMLNSDEIVMIVDLLLKKSKIPYVLDPVMRAKDNTSLLKNEAVEVLKNSLLPAAFLVTPNIPEAEILTGMDIETVEDMKQACIKLASENVLLKGGHLAGDDLVDILYHDGKFFEYQHPKIQSQNTHGTGCTLASAITSQLALGLSLPKACENGIEYIQKAIVNNYSIGLGQSPLNHFYMLENTDA
jgi:hydroxymethylpyrimidine/phosphomethylpyrimidine kinase